MTERREELIADALALLRAHGLTPSIRENGKHVKIRWLDCGRNFTLIVSKTPGTSHARQQSRATLQRNTTHSKSEQEPTMREHLRRDGCVVLTGDEGDQDQVIVEGIVTTFIPNRAGSRCVCGAALLPWNLRHVAEGAEICCNRCHRVHGLIGLGVRVHR